MNQPISLYFALLSASNWNSADEFLFPDQYIEHWLTESGSLSRRFDKLCQQFSVQVVENRFISAHELRDDECHLLAHETCLLRSVILSGDGVPWVVAKTLIPQSTLCEQDCDFYSQGDVPLGFTVFSKDNINRDALQIASHGCGEERLFARRSRLWMNAKPMLVAELFLPLSPIYSEERV